MATKTVKKIRITQVAKDLGIPTKDIIEKCISEGIEGVTSPQASIPIGLAETIKEWFGGSGSTTGAEIAASVDVVGIRERVQKAAPKKKKVAGDAPPSDAPISVTETSVAASASAVTIEEPIASIDIAAKQLSAAASSVKAKVQSNDGIDGGTSVVDAPVAPPKPVAPVLPPKPVVVVPPPKPFVPAPMNVPTRPVRARPTSQVLDQPTKTSLSGPKVIRVEAADNIAAPRPRTGGQFGTNRPPMGRTGGPSVGTGAGAGAGAGDPANRRGALPPSKRRPSDAGRTGRADPARDGSRSNTEIEERASRIGQADGFFRKHRTSTRPSHSPQGRAVVAKPQGPVHVPNPVSVKELSELTGVKMAELMKKSLLAGNPITINTALDGDQSMELMMAFNIEIEIDEAKTASDEIEERFAARTRSDERSRPAVVTILGHVDHGKTTLLDRIRSTNVAAGEAGGITQSTRAFQVEVKAGDQPRMITFIDAVDGLMPQTIESINHIKAAKVSVIVALNKIDRPEFDEKNLQRIYGELAKNDLNPVPWGGSVEVALVSGLKGTGLPELLETIALQADVLDLKADWGGHAQGSVLEARMEEGRGPVAQLLVQEGCLKRGDFVVVGRAFGRVRDIVSDRNERITSAEPTAAVAISGIDMIPDAGDKFYVVESLAAAEQAAIERRAFERDRELSAPKVTLDNIFETMAKSKKKELPLIVKGDVQGSVETLKVVLGRIKAEDVSISIKHAGVGGINESDVELAATTGAVIVGFNVTSNAKSRQLAEVRKIDIRLYEVIYQLTDDMDKAVRGLLEPEIKLQVLGHADVRAVFKITKVGAIAGCYVTDGVIERNAQIRVTRDGIVVEKDRRLEQLKRFKEDAKEVRSGNECGMKINGYDDIREGDVLECYRTITVRPLGGGNA